MPAIAPDLPAHELITEVDEPYGGSRSGGWRDVAWAEHSHDIVAGERRLRYVDLGNGDVPVLLIHGHGSTWQYWLEVMTRLSAGRRVIALDLPGFGRSEPYPFAEVSMERTVAAVVTLVDRLGLERVDLVGHSLGSLIAIELAAASPARVRTLTLAGGPALTQVALFKHPLATLARHPRAVRALAEDMLSAGIPFPAPVRHLVAGRARTRGLAFGGYVARPTDLPADVAEALMLGVGAPAYFQVLRRARRFDVAELELLACPVLLVNAVADAFVPRADVDAFLARRPSATSYLIADAGHLVTVEYPQTFCRLLTGFLDGAEKPAGALSGVS